MPKTSNGNIVLIGLSLVGISLCAEHIIEALKLHAKPNSITMWLYLCIFFQTCSSNTLQIHVWIWRQPVSLMWMRMIYHTFLEMVSSFVRISFLHICSWCTLNMILFKFICMSRSLRSLAIYFSIRDNGLLWLVTDTMINILKIVIQSIGNILPECRNQVMTQPSSRNHSCANTYEQFTIVWYPPESVPLNNIEGTIIGKQYWSANSVKENTYNNICKVNQQIIAIQNYLWWNHMHLGLYKLFVENTFSKCTLQHISYQ